MRGDSTAASSAWPARKMPTTMAIGTRSGQNCTAASTVAVIRPSAHPTNGMKARTPVASPTSSPYSRPAALQHGRVEDAEDQAHGALAADEGGDGVVDVVAEAADDRRVVARQPAVDLREHRVPVDEQIEHDERRDEQQREKVEQREAAVPQRLRGPRDQAAPVLGQRARGALQCRLELGEAAAEAFARGGLEQRLQAFELAGQRDRELLHLREEEGTTKTSRATSTTAPSATMRSDPSFAAGPAASAGRPED